MQFLITRPEPQASKSRDRLIALGHSVLCEPCQEVKRNEAVLQHANAYIITSQNGVEHGLSFVPNKDAMIFAVGERTAEAAEALGFEEIYAAEGDTESLFEMIMSRWLPEDGTLLHLSGAEIVSDISSLLSAIGYSANRQVVYTAIPQDKPEPLTLNAIKNTKIDAILFYSARAVTIFNAWMHDAKLERHLENITAVALSPRIAEELGPEKLGFHWKCIKIAKETNENALIDAATE